MRDLYAKATGRKLRSKYCEALAVGVLEGVGFVGLDCREAEACRLVGGFLSAEGKEYAARDEWNKFRISFGKYELEMERYYDQQMCMASLSRIFNAISTGSKDKAEDVVFEA